MLCYREFEHKENSKRLVLEIIFRESDGKMKSASGLIKAGFEPKGGFRNWCREVAKAIRDVDPDVKFIVKTTAFGWNSAELIRVNQICEFSKKHPHGFVGAIQLKKEK